MSICEPCAAAGHTGDDCANQSGPMIQRACTCRCTQAESDPAPYWTQQGEAQ